MNPYRLKAPFGPLGFTTVSTRGAGRCNLRNSLINMKPADVAFIKLTCIRDALPLDDDALDGFTASWRTTRTAPPGAVFGRRKDEPSLLSPDC